MAACLSSLDLNVVGGSSDAYRLKDQHRTGIPSGRHLGPCTTVRGGCETKRLGVTRKAHNHGYNSFCGGTREGV